MNIKTKYYPAQGVHTLTFGLKYGLAVSVSILDEAKTYKDELERIKQVCQSIVDLLEQVHNV